MHLKTSLEEVHRSAKVIQSMENMKNHHLSSNTHTHTHTHTHTRRKVEKRRISYMRLYYRSQVPISRLEGKEFIVNYLKLCL
jgi:hypothetical protein